MDDFVPSETIRLIIQKWWLLLTLMILGGSAGAFAARIQKPVYESQASITTSIDFAYTDRLSADEEDYLIATVGDVISSSAVFEVVKQVADEAGMPIDDELIRNQFSQARQGYRWELTVRAGNPYEAQQLTHFWVQAAGNQLAEMRENSLDQLKFHAAEISLQNCLSQMVVLEPSSANCSLTRLEDLRTALSGTFSTKDDYSQSGSILLSKISTEITDDAYLPVQPIVFKSNLLTLAGCACGLIIAIGLAIFRKPVKNESKKA